MKEPPKTLSRDEINLLMWCLGFAEGRAREEDKHEQLRRMIHQLHIVREKLMSMTPSDEPQ